MEFSSRPFIPGVTGNPEGIYEILNEAGIDKIGKKYKALIDLNERTISVSEHAKGDFRMGSFHKDLGEFLVECSEDEEMSNLDIIKVCFFPKPCFIK